MIIGVREYNDLENIEFLFTCNKCSKKPDDKKSFKVIRFARGLGVILRCEVCGNLISRKVSRLEKREKEAQARLNFNEKENEK